MNNISHMTDCYGCGVCAMVCPAKIISISLNEEGFYEPRIEDADKCLDCGLCLEVCAFNHDRPALETEEIHSYAGWSDEEAVRRECSSGGVGFEVGRSLILQGYKVCGVRYNAEKQRAEHYIAATVGELMQSAGSKYIQSYTPDGFMAVGRRGKYLVTGTPCQMDSFRRCIRKLHIEDNFVLMDFFCHGVPSMLLWKKYLGEVEKRIGPVASVSWRNKSAGWHDSWALSASGGRGGANSGQSMSWHDSYRMKIREKKRDYDSRMSQGDLFYAFFLGNTCLGRACYNDCKYKYNHSSADIRIGDLWGPTYRDNEEGVSAAVAFTAKGDGILRQCGCTLVEHPFAVVAEGQMKVCPEMPGMRKRILRRLRSSRSLGSIHRAYQISMLPKRIINRIRRIFR